MILEANGVKVTKRLICKRGKKTQFSVLHIKIFVVLSSILAILRLFSHFHTMFSTWILMTFPVGVKLFKKIRWNLNCCCYYCIWFNIDRNRKDLHLKISLRLILFYIADCRKKRILLVLLHSWSTIVFPLFYIYNVKQRIKQPFFFSCQLYYLFDVRINRSSQLFLTWSNSVIERLFIILFFSFCLI